MDAKLIRAISDIVAQCLNANEAGACAARLDAIFPAGADACAKLAALGAAPVYALVARQPGYANDGRPGYLPQGADLKQAVLNEIEAMIEADFEKDEHAQTWHALAASVRATPDADFAPGVAVNCPDDYLLTLDRHFASELLRKYDAFPPWHCQNDN